LQRTKEKKDSPKILLSENRDFLDRGRMESASIDSKTHRIEDYAPPVWTTPEINIRFELDLERTLVRTEYLVQLNGVQASQTYPSLFLNGISLHLISVRVNGLLCEPNTFRIHADGLELFHPPSAEFSLWIENSISPKNNTALEGLYLSGSMLCTQNEPEGFRKITYSIDRPDNLSKYRVTLCGDKERFPVLLSNGNHISTKELGEGKLESVWYDPFPKPSYLFAVVAGRLTHVQDFFITSSGRKVDLRIYVDERNKEKTDFAMMSLKEAMRWDEETFGLEYDLDLYMIVAVDDFNMGAMENKGLNLFNSKLVLADKRSATDETFESILGVVAHEYFHNWTGNRVTLRNWFNLTLKEGLTVFRDQWFTEDNTDLSVKRIKDVLFLLEHQFQEDAGPMSHPILPKSYVEMNNFYTVTVYEKGAEVIRMLSLLLGRDKFKDGLRYYLNKYDGTGVTYEEFIAAMEFVSGTDLQVFRNWYHRKGTPQYRLTENWNAEKQTYSLEFSDLDKDSLVLCFPMSIALFNEEGNVLAEETLNIEGKNFKMNWDGISSKPILSFQRGFSAPIKIHFERKADELAFLAKYEHNGVARFFALQEVIFQIFRDALQNKNEIKCEEIFIVYEEILDQSENIPKDFLSYLLSIPSLTQMSSELSVYDFEILDMLRTELIQKISSRFQKSFVEMYKSHVDTMPVQTRSEIGKRRLKNLSLYFLLHDPSHLESYADIALQQQREAKHMSEEITVLKFLCEVGHIAKEKSIDDFYIKWKAEPLVLDYWFSAQVAFGTSALSSAEALLKIPEFHWENPNRVRALIGTFVRNPRSFHLSDGSGYLFLGKALEKLNAINPQIAANLGKLYQSVQWQKPKSKQIAKNEIKRLLQLDNLSSELEEVLSKIQKGL